MYSNSDGNGLRQSEAAILRVLNDERKALTVSALICKVKKAGATDEAMIRAAMWHLIDVQGIILTPDWKVALKEPSAAARAS